METAFSLNQSNIQPITAIRNKNHAGLDLIYLKSIYMNNHDNI